MSKRIEFFKMNGAGNDFVVVDNRSKRITQARAYARKLCNRHRGIGADGLLLLERSPKASYRMMYYNSDGSYGGMCGNGGRCVAAFAVAMGIAPRKHSFEALGHIYKTEVHLSGAVRLWMKEPKILKIGLSLEYNGTILSVHTIDTGSPHAVVYLQKGILAGLEVGAIGNWIRRHSAFSPAGVNANFVERIGPRTIRMRTYERGVEAETQACGTGSVACSIIGAVTVGLRPPITVVTHSGEKLRVDFTRSETGFRDVVLEGPAIVSFRGEIDV
jgi:diaminopimelate epimerase